MHKPYKPETPNNELIRLHNNEAFEQWVKLEFESSELGDLNVYPDNLLIDLKQKLLNNFLREKSLFTDNIIFDVGSAGVIKDLLILHKSMSYQDLVVPQPCFSLYQLFAEELEINIKRIDYRQDFSLDVEALKEIIIDKDTLVIASPNNPTGVLFTENNLQEVRSFFQGLIIIDEAYIEYAGIENSLINKVQENKNIIITRSFSKAWGLASARMGYAVLPDKYTEAVQSIRLPYSITKTSKIIIDQALDQVSGLSTFVTKSKDNEAFLVKELESLGLNVISCNTNFILIEFENPELVQENLFTDYKIQTRYYDHSLTKKYLRITVGTNENNRKLIRALSEIIKQ